MSYTPPTGDATNNRKGLIKLAGDLSGTADQPTIIGLASKADSIHTHTISDTNGMQTALDSKVDRSQVDTDDLLSANSDSKIATQKAIKSYVDSRANITSPTTTKGDLIVRGSTDTRLPVGINGTVLMADDSQPLGVKWSTTSSSTPADNVITGLDQSPTADNAPIIQSAIDSRRTTEAGALRLPRGTWHIKGRITLYDGVSLSGESSSDSYSATELRCDAAGAGIDIVGNAGYLQDIEINGNSIAINPLKFGSGTDRTVFRVDVHDALEDNLIIEYLQNSSFISCTFNRSGRDGIVLDKESGGIHFLRSNVSHPGRYGIRIDQTTTPTTGYEYPQHIRFSHSLIERPQSNNPLIFLNKGFFIVFDTCIFGASTSMTSASMFVNNGSYVVVDTCEWSGANVNGITAIDNHAGSRITVEGTQWIISAAYFLNNPSGVVQMNGDVFLNGATLITPSTPSNGDINVTKDQQSVIISARQNTGAVVLKGRITSETGERFRLHADGRLAWGDGNGYSFGTSIYRQTDGKVAIVGGLATNGDICMTNSSSKAGFFGAAPIAKPVITGSRNGNIALDSLLTQLTELGLIDNQTTA